MSLEILLEPHLNQPRPRLYRDLLGRYLLPLWPRALAMACLLLSGIALQLAGPQVIRYFIDTAQAGGGNERAQWLAAAVFLAFALGQHGLLLAADYASQVVSWAATNRLRSDLARHSLGLDMAFHKRHTPGEMIERLEGDVGRLANFFSSFFIQVLGNLLLAAGILALLFREDPRVGSAMTAYTLVVFFALNRIQRLAVPRWAASRQAAADMSGYLEERISGTEDLRAVGAEDYALRRLLGLMRLPGKVPLGLGGGLPGIQPDQPALCDRLRGRPGAGSFAIRARRSDDWGGLPGRPLHRHALRSLQKIREQADDFQQASASLGRVQSLFDLQPGIRDRGPERNRRGSASRDGAPLPAPLARNAALPSGPLSVTFEQISFHYDNNGNVLEGVDFSLPPGRTLGILGRTGSGKSTLTRLLFRLYDPTGGSIRLGSARNGASVDLRDLPLHELRERVSLVTQDVQLFQATVRDNLTFFDPSIPDERLETILRELSMWDWVSALPEGLSTTLGTGGQGLSAGEAQLLAFARVFLKNPDLVVLDEASSRLDPATEMRMERAIDRLFAGRTGVIIAHRLRTVQRADLILILEGGKVIEFGRRADLAADPGSNFNRLLQVGLEEALA
jgi:ATP-binding cassette, subfamily B, bacterial